MAKSVYRDYDQHALDAEYNNREKVKESADWLSRYAVASAEARTALDCRLDLAYGAHPGERLDVFPARGGPAPVHVFIHGGYWHRLDKSDSSFVARAFQPSGAAVVVVNYALIPTVDMDGLLRQCRASIVWVHRNAASFGGDPNRIFVSGHSAGGHLAAMLMSTDWSAFAGLRADVIKAGCGISGLYDLEPIRLSYLNEVLKLTPETARRLSPVHCPPARSGPLLLAVGELEGPEYHRQGEEMAAIWRTRRLPCQALDMPAHNHFTILGELEDPGPTLSRFLLRHTGRRRRAEAPGDPRGGAHRRHASRAAAGDDAPAPACPDHHARIAVHPAHERTVPPGAGPHPVPDRRRDSRVDGVQARRPSGALARAPPGGCRSARYGEPPPADRLLGDGEPDRVGAWLPDRRHRDRRHHGRRRLHARPRPPSDRAGGRLPDGAERYHLGSGAPADCRAGSGAPDDARLRPEPARRRAARARSERPDPRRPRRSPSRLALAPRPPRGREPAEGRRAPRARRHLLARARNRRRGDRPGGAAAVAAQHRGGPPAGRPRRSSAEPHLEGPDRGDQG